MTPTRSVELRNLLRGSLLTTGSTAFINFTTNIFLARQCGPDILGNFVVIAAWAHVAIALLAPGFDQAYIQRPDQPGRWRAAVWLTLGQIAVMLTLPLALLYSVTTSNLGRHLPYIDPTIFQWIIVSFCLSTAGNLALAIPAAALDYRRINLVRLLSAVAAASCAFAMTLRTEVPSIAPLIVRELSAGGALIVGALLIVRRSALQLWGERPTLLELRSTVAFSLDLWALNSLERVLQRLEYLILGFVVTTSDVGVYFAVRSLFDGVYGVVVAPVQTVLFSYLCRTKSISSSPLLSGNRRNMVFVSIAVGALATGLVFSPPVFGAIFGSQFIPPKIVPIAFLFVLIGLLYFEVVKVSLMVVGSHRALVPARGLQFVLLIVLMPILGHTFGLAGAAVAAAAAAGGLSLCAYRAQSRPISIR